MLAFLLKGGYDAMSGQKKLITCRNVEKRLHIILFGTLLDHICGHIHQSYNFEVKSHEDSQI